MEYFGIKCSEWLNTGVCAMKYLFSFSYAHYLSLFYDCMYVANKLVISLYSAIFFLYQGIFTMLGHVLSSIHDKPHPAVFYVFIFMMFVPEIILLVSKSFRLWIKEGIEDGDGKLNRDDLKDLRIHYAAIWMLRMFVLFGLLMIFYEVEIDTQYYVMPFCGALGIEGLAVWKNIYRK